MNNENQKMNPIVKAMAEAMYDMAKETIADTELHMCAAIYSPNNEDATHNYVDLEGTPSKQAAAFVVKEIAKKTGATAIVFTCEGYSLPQDVMKEYAKGNRRYPKISDYPESFEIVMINVQTYEGDWLGSVRIEGSLELGNRTIPDAIEFIKVTQGTGATFSNLLPALATQSQSVH